MATMHAEPTHDTLFDLLVIGAGPAGLSAAYAAKCHGLNYLVIERGSIVSTIAKYPLGKTIFSDGNDVEILPGTLRSVGSKPTREEVLTYYLRFAQDEHHLAIRTNESVLDIRRIDASGHFSVKTTTNEYRARAVLAAIGVGHPNRLGVPGEVAERVYHIYQEIELFRGRPVLVVGGGNSAAEAALDLMQAGALVTLAIRRPSLDRSGNSKGAAIQPSVRKPLEQALNLNKLRVLFEATVLSIGERNATLRVAGEHMDVECDRVFALLGTTPDSALLSRAGAIIDPDGRPLYDPATYETTVRGLYVTGHITREINLRNAVSLPPVIVKRLAQELGGLLVDSSRVSNALQESPLPPSNPDADVETPGFLDAERNGGVYVDSDAIVDLHLSPTRVRHALSTVLGTEGVMAAVLADSGTGAVLGVGVAEAGYRVSLAAFEGGSIIRAQDQLLKAQGQGIVEDIVLSFTSQYHILRPLSSEPGIFLYLVARRGASNLGMARYVLARAERHVAVSSVEPPPGTIISPDVSRAERLPPGQNVTLKWPVLHFGSIHTLDVSSWRIRVHGLVEHEVSLSFDDLLALPRASVLADFHCVTRWSRLDNLWEGVTMKVICSLVRPKPTARFAVIHAAGEWTTNLPVEDLTAEDTLLAYRHNGVSLEPEHGFPLRLVVPRLYAWKSAKWVTGIEFVDSDRPGFWEQCGYHMRGNPWLEQRRQLDELTQLPGG